jgi:Fuseless
MYHQLMYQAPNTGSTHLTCIRLIHHFRRRSFTKTKKFQQIPTKRRHGQVPILTEQSPFAAAPDSKAVFYLVFVGMCSASFWRGAWYILDDSLFPNNKELSAISSLLLGTTGMFSVQGLFERGETFAIRLVDLRSRNHTWLTIRSIQIIHSALRFAAIYSLVLSVVCIWRGTWMSWDLLYAKYYNAYAATSIVTNDVNDTKQILMEAPLTNINLMDGEATMIHASDPGHALRSGILSHGTALLILSCMGIVASVFAPPAAVSVIRDNTIFSSKTCIERLLYRRNTKKGLHFQRHLKFMPRWKQRKLN